MSRSGYSDDLDNWQLIMWRGAVHSAISGKRGQKLLREMLTALDAMPEKALIAHELETADGHYCALGVVGKARGLDMSTLDPEEAESVAKSFDIAGALVQEISYMNDECGFNQTPERRWARMRTWVVNNLNIDGLEG